MQRRTFLSGVLALPLACGTRSTARGTADVIVIGGGLAGLGAARTLRGLGVDCRVIEAQGRLGGRVDTQVLDGGTVGERGAQFVNTDMRGMLSLLESRGVATTALASTREHRIVTSQGVVVADERALEGLLTPESIAEIERHLGAGDVPLGALLDDLGDAAKAEVRSALQELTGREPGELSARGILEVAATFDSDRPPEELSITGGASNAVAALAASLERTPVLGTPVREIQASGRDLRVITDDGALTCRGVVIAVPPTAASRIALPSSAEALGAALGGYVAGAMVKTTLVFETPFWRTSADTATDFSFLEPSGVQVVDVTSGADARLVVLAGATTGRDLAARSADERARAITRWLGLASGVTPPAPREVIEGVWVDDPWSGGGYNSWIRYGAPPSAVATLRAGSGGIVFASSELATRFAGYMEGALDAGTRAGTDLAGRLR